MDILIALSIGALIGFGVGFLIAYDLGLKEAKRKDIETLSDKK